jgi:hypothetical protein
MILDPALGDIMQEQRDVEQSAALRLDRAHHEPAPVLIVPIIPISSRSSNISQSGG